MSTGQRIIKSLAVAFGLFLTFTIFFSIVGGLYAFTSMFSKDNVIEENTSILWNQSTENIKYLDIEVNSSNLVIKPGNSFIIETNNKHIKYKIDNNEYQKTKKYLVELLGIEEIIKKPVRTLSLGERMRCEIASSLLHKPEILFLDEPTIGLDAISKKIVRDFIKKINKENKVTVILTTHDMNDIEALAKRIILMERYYMMEILKH